MKTFQAACIIAASASAQQFFEARVVADNTNERVPLETEVFRNINGSLQEKNVYSDITESTITMPTKSFWTDPIQRTEHIKHLTSMIKNQKESNDEPIYTCENRETPEDPTGFFDLFPVYVGEIETANPTVSYTDGRCFENISAEFEQTAVDAFDVTITVSGHKKLTCVERLLIANTEMFHMESFKKAGTHKMSFSMPTVVEQTDVGFGGVKIMMICDSV